MLHPAAERLTLQDDPSIAALFEVVSDLHAAARRAASFDAKLDLRMGLIAGDRNAAQIHVHRAHIERADGSQVLENSCASGVVIICLLAAGSEAKKRTS